MFGFINKSITKIDRFLTIWINWDSKNLKKVFSIWYINIISFSLKLSKFYLLNLNLFHKKVIFKSSSILIRKLVLSKLFK